MIDVYLLYSNKLRFMRYYGLSLIFLLASLSVTAQTIQTEKKSVRFKNGIFVFEICKVNPDTIVFLDKEEYVWYNEDFTTINSTKGGCGGKLLHGNYKHFDKNGNLISDFNFYLGLRHGQDRKWDEDGNIIHTANYKHGTSYYHKEKSEDGDLWIEMIGPFLKDGTIKKVYTSFGTLISEEKILDVTKFETKFETTIYYPSGKVEQKFTKHMLLDWFYGDFFEYYENGNIRFHGIYDDSYRIGEWKWFNRDGSINHSEKYKKEVNKYSNGNTKSEGSYYFDEDENEWKKDGEWAYYYEDGKYDKRIVYELDVVKTEEQK